MKIETLDTGHFLLSIDVREDKKRAADLLPSPKRHDKKASVIWVGT